MAQKKFVRPMRNAFDRLSIAEKTVLYYSQSPTIAAKDLLNVRLAWFQRVIVRKIWFVPYVINVSGRGTGKTLVNAISAVLLAMLKPNVRVGVYGPTKRQGDYIFNEIESLYKNSPFMRKATLGKISRTMERNIIRFKNNSFVESMPVGNSGDNIRGARYNYLFLDEFAQFDDSVVNLVILPFLAVQRGQDRNKLIISSSAYYRWNHLWDRFKFYRIQEAINPHEYAVCNFYYEDVMMDPNSPFKMDLNIVQHEKEIMTKADFEMEWCFLPDTNVEGKHIKDYNPGDTVTTHLYRKRKIKKLLSRYYKGTVIRLHVSMIDRDIVCTPDHPFLLNNGDWKKARLLNIGDVLQTLSGIPVSIISKDFEHYDGIVYNLSVDEDESYSVEGIFVHNCGIFPEDEGTFFPVSLIENSTPRPPSREPVQIELSGYEDARYVLGVDVGRVEGGSNFAICIGRIEDQTIKLVRVITLNGEPYQNMHNKIREVCETYNVVLIHMDRGGGGETLKDLMKEVWKNPVTGVEQQPIVEIEEENSPPNGSKILRMINFQGGRHTSLFTNLKAEMEHSRVLFPIPFRRHDNPDMERCGQEIRALRTELTVIRPRTLGSNIRFEVPNKFKMDRAVALALCVDALKAIREPSYEEDVEDLAVGFWA